MVFFSVLFYFWSIKLNLEIYLLIQCDPTINDVFICLSSNSINIRYHSVKAISNLHTLCSFLWWYGTHLLYTFTNTKKCFSRKMPLEQNGNVSRSTQLKPSWMYDADVETLTHQHKYTRPFFLLEHIENHIDSENTILI